jgi:hypothetical protein
MMTLRIVSIPTLIDFHLGKRTLLERPDIRGHRNMRSHGRKA